METNNKSIIANRIFYIIFALLILGSVGATYYRIVILKDYQILAEVSCDPMIESCFYYEGVMCEDGVVGCIPEESYSYKFVSKKASEIYKCDLTEEKIGCGEELFCTEGEEDCFYTYCNPNDLAEGENCAE